jgi:hypothetical protein
MSRNKNGLLINSGMGSNLFVRKKNIPKTNSSSTYLQNALNPSDKIQNSALIDTQT